MSQAKPARSEREILNELRELSKILLRPDLSIDRTVLSRADRVLWEACELGLFGRDRVVQRLTKAHRLRAADSLSGLPAHHGFVARMARDWFPVVFDCYGTLGWLFEFDSTPTDDHLGWLYRNMLRASPSLLRSSKSVGLPAAIATVIEQNFEDTRWGISADAIVNRLRVMGVNKINGHRVRTEIARSPQLHGFFRDADQGGYLPPAAKL